MPRFPPLSEREKHLIVLLHQEAPNLSYRAIARELGILFPEDNGGSRDRDTIYGYLKGAGYI